MRSFCFVLATVALLAVPFAQSFPVGIPGFAVGCFTNGNHYSVGQTFTLAHDVIWYGASVAFGETVGTPTGSVRWRLRQWIVTPYGSYAGKVLDVGFFEPKPMAYNTIVPVAPTYLSAGHYVITFTSVDLQKCGSYWNILASPGDVDVYPDGDLVQGQDGKWLTWSDQDLIGEYDFIGPDGFSIWITVVHRLRA